MAFLVMDAVYLLAVFAWTAFLPPLGRDWAALANFAPFGDRVWACHGVNIGLMYAAMLLVFLLTRLATRGPWWLGSVAAVVMMAHPLKAEAMLNVCGAGDLLPALLSLAALIAYGWARRGRGSARLVPAVLLFGCALLLAPGQGGLLVAVAAWEGFIVPREQRRWTVLSPFLAITALGWFMYSPVIAAAPLKLSGAVWPLVYLVYPIGLLPETASAFRAQPLLPALVMAALAVAALWLIRSVRHPAFSFGLLAAAGFALFGEHRPVDPVHLIGGGRMLCSIALFAVALAGLFHRIMQHPAWRGPTVWLTTVLCIVLMALQVQTNLAWGRAAKSVEQFRRAAFTAAAQHPGQRLAVLPDFRYCDHAPVEFAESVRQTTPFGRAFPVEVLASYDPDTLDPGAFALLNYSPKGAGFAAALRGPLLVTGPHRKTLTPDRAMPWNMLQWFAPRDWTAPKHTVEVHIVPDGEPFPEMRVAYP